MKDHQPSSTAERVALTRASECLFPEINRICSDPYSKYFLTGRLKRLYMYRYFKSCFSVFRSHHTSNISASVLYRTRFMDDFLITLVRAGATQIVNLGAGYDTRAIRFQEHLKNVRIFEVDHPATQKRKRSVLKRAFVAIPGNITFVPIHFDRENIKDRLFEECYNPKESTVFIWEGVSYYISQSAVDSTLSFISANSGPQSAIVFDFLPNEVTDGKSLIPEIRTFYEFLKNLGEELTWGCSPYLMSDLLTKKGFKDVRIFSGRQLKDIYGNNIGRNVNTSKLFFIASASL